jgi:tetratricopeptide (TPR) repeat protein
VCQNPRNENETIVNMRYIILGVGGVLLAGSASALSLGPSKGGVLLGAPIDLVFEVEPDPGADVGSSCISADVIFGERGLNASDVRVEPLPAMAGRAGAVRVQVSKVVDEPIVQVKLSAGCSGRVSRTYTFFADLPQGVTNSSPVDVGVIAAAQGRTETQAGNRRAEPSVQASEGDHRSNVSHVGGKGKARNPAARVKPKPSAKTKDALVSVQTSSNTNPPPKPAAGLLAAPPRTKGAASVSAPSRLVMEPLDSWGEQAPLPLRPSSEMAVAPASAPQRAQAAAAWKALNTAAQDVQREEERVRALEAELVSLRAHARAQETSLRDLKQRIDAIEKERFTAAWVYALLGLLGLASLALLWIWLRTRREAERAVQAWRDSVALGPQGGTSDQPQEPSVASPSQQYGQDAQGAAPALERGLEPLSTQPLEISPKGETESRMGPLTVPMDFSPGSAQEHLASQIVHPEELFDVQQQAEFFRSVGEHERAIDTLKKHIAAHEQTSPLAYLELLRLYHVLGRADDFEQLRVQFQRHFNARVPSFKEFGPAGKDLEHYPQALEAIQAVWATPAVDDLLEQYLFRREGVGEAEPFDLAAFDDLLLLLAIVQTTPASARGVAQADKKTVRLPEPGQGSKGTDAPSWDLDFDFADIAARPASESVQTPLDLDLSDPQESTQPPSQANRGAVP